MAVLTHDNYETILSLLTTELNSLATAGYSAASAAQGADGTNYEDAPSSTNPGTGMFAGTFVGSDASAAKRVVLPDVVLPPGLWKAIFKNTAGATLSASNNTLKCRPHNLLTT